MKFRRCTRRSLEDIINKSGRSNRRRIKTGAVAKLLEFLNDFLPGIEGSLEALNQLEGFIVAPQMELAFKGIAKRSFSNSLL